MRINKCLVGSCLLIAGCNAQDVTTQATNTTTVSSSSKLVVKPSKMSIAIKSAGPVYSISDLASGAASVGDTNAEPKRVLMTFPLSAFVGKSVLSAKIKLSYDGKSPDNAVTYLGALSIYKIASKSSFVESDYNASDVFLKEVISYASQLSGLTNKTVIELDVTESVKNAISASDSHFTIKLRFNSESGNGNCLVNFYGHYLTTGPLEPYIPRLDVTYE